MKLYKHILMFFLCLLICSSLISYVKVNHLASGIQYNYLPANFLFEVLIFIFALFAFVTKKSFKLYGFAFFSIIYIFYGSLLFLLKDNLGNLSDLLLMFKPFVYICLLVIFFDKSIFNENFINKLYIIMVGAFILKYCISIFFFDIERPGLFTENNFEMMFISLLFLATYDDNKEYSSFNYILLAFLSFLSFSRSAIIFIFFIFLVIKFKDFLRLKIFKLLLLLSLAIAVLLIFFSRLGGSGLESVDRYIFFINFLYEMNNGEWFRWLIGFPPMTNVSYETANALKYYYLVFSDPDRLIAFSPVFNSFIFRVIYDHGIFGLLFILFFNYNLVLNSCSSKNIAYASTIILIVNGLSVSSFHSVYFILGTIFIVTREKFRLKHT